MKAKTSYYALPGPMSTGPTIATEAVILHVCSHYTTDLKKIQDATRKKEITFIRHLLMFLLRHKAKLSNSEIAKIVCRERTDVIRGIKSIQNYLETDSLNKRQEIVMHLSYLSGVA